MVCTATAPYVCAGYEDMVAEFVEPVPPSPPERPQEQLHAGSMCNATPVPTIHPQAAAGEGSPPHMAPPAHTRWAMEQNAWDLSAVLHGAFKGSAEAAAGLPKRNARFFQVQCLTAAAKGLIQQGCMM